MRPPFGFQERIRPICEGTFPRLGFTQKMSVLDALQALLETARREGAASLPCQPTTPGCICSGDASPSDGLFDTRFPPGGTDGPPAGSKAVALPAGRFPLCLAPRFLETVRTDPFPRVRRAAVRLMIRVEPQALPGSCIEDYLSGLEGGDAVSACAVLLFIVRRFGPGSVMRVIEHMDARGAGIPPAMIHLLEGICEGDLHGVDPYRVRMLLRGCRAGEQARRGPGKPSAAARPASRPLEEALSGLEEDRAARERFERVRRRGRLHQGQR